MANLVLHLTAPQGANPVEFTEAGGWIGRAPDNELVLDDPARNISSRHARIDWDGATFGVTDQSLNGTSVNGRRLDKGERMTLRTGDEIAIGPARIAVAPPGGALPAAPLPTTPQPPPLPTALPAAPPRPSFAPDPTRPAPPTFDLDLDDLIGPGTPPEPEPPRRVLPSFEEFTAQPPPPTPDEAPPYTPPPPPEPSPSRGTDPAAALDAFWAGLGAGPPDAPGAALMPTLMLGLGRALREAVLAAAALNRPDAPVPDAPAALREELHGGRARLADQLRAAFATNAARTESMAAAVEQAAGKMAESLTARAIEARLGDSVRARTSLFRRAELWRQFRALEDEIREAAENRFRKDLAERLRAEPRRLTYTAPGDQ